MTITLPSHRHNHRCTVTRLRNVLVQRGRLRRHACVVPAVLGTAEPVLTPWLHHHQQAPWQCCCPEHLTIQADVSQLLLPFPWNVPYNSAQRSYWPCHECSVQLHAWSHDWCCPTNSKSAGCRSQRTSACGRTQTPLSLPPTSKRLHHTHFADKDTIFAPL